MDMSEAQGNALERKVRDRAQEKQISHFEAVNELLPETFDTDAEEVLHMWRFPLHPRKQPRTPVARLSRHVALDRPVLGMFLVLFLVAYPCGVVYLLKHGYRLLGASLALPIVLWYAGNYKGFVAIYRCFLPAKEHLKRMIAEMRPRFVEDRRVMGDDSVEAELHASEQLEHIRTVMLEGADKIEPRGCRALRWLALGLLILIGAYIVASLFLN